jgi:hypothetical protein
MLICLKKFSENTRVAEIIIHKLEIEIIYRYFSSHLL